VLEQKFAPLELEKEIQKKVKKQTPKMKFFKFCNRYQKLWNIYMKVLRILTKRRSGGA
jgi:hypothetical protein